MASFSFSVRNSDDVGVLGRRKKDSSPKATVKDPSYDGIYQQWRRSKKKNYRERGMQGSRTRMKIHCHPLCPTSPSIARMADASNPEKAPVNDAAVNKSAERS